MLGRRYQVYSAQRLGVCQWQITFAKHLLRGWRDPPLLEKSFQGGGSHYCYVRQVEVVLTQTSIPADALGPDVRVVGYSHVVPPYYPKPELLSRYVRRIWYLSALNWRDGILFLPDETCINPRGGPIRMLPMPPEHIERAQETLQHYLTDREAIATGKIRYEGLWMTPEQFQATKKFEEANRRL